MVRWFRQLPLSLAAKCQLLFGGALALIIGAALYVPWQRMEQLTERINERAASAVVRTMLAEHVADQTRALGGQPAATRPTTTPVLMDGQSTLPPQLIPLAALKSPATSGRFERSALARFERDPDMAFFARRFSTNDGEGYRYAEPIYARTECLRCHGEPRPGQMASALLPVPVTQPTPAPPKTMPLLGLAVVEIPAQVSQGEVLLNRTLLLIAVALAGTLAVLTFHLIFTHLILRPVRVLQEAAEKVSQGDLNIRSDINSRDEFQQLSETLNTMLMNLKTSADQLRAVNKSLDLRLGQLAEANLALFESNRLKSEFLASVSHELRTPLNSILGFADLLRDAASRDPKSTRYLRNILASGKSLLELINDLLDLAKIEAGKMEVRSEPLPLADLFEGLASLLKPLTEEKSLTIVTRLAADVPILQTDPGRLQQILYNLLSNAIKFSAPEQTIDLTAEMQGPARVRLCVTDRGPGIDPRNHELIFEKFRQLDGSHTREHSGTGLGLAISKELAMLLGGTIGVHSVPGEGATFWVELPVQIEAGAHDLRARLALT